VIEVLEGIKLDANFVTAFEKLKQAVYLNAFDDFHPSLTWLPLIALADFIKVYALATSPSSPK
jgi:c-di-GMP-related signal transduction protein